MHLRRSKDPERRNETADEREASAPALAAVSLRALIHELGERDWEAFPAGLWAAVVGDLEAQAAFKKTPFPAL